MIDLCAAGLHLIPALIWLIITRHLWATSQSKRARIDLLFIAPFATGVITAHMLLHAAWFLLPAELRFREGSAIDLGMELTGIASLALGRHMFRLMPIPEQRPGREWLVFNYGIASIAGLAYTLGTFGIVPAFGRFLLAAAYMVLSPLCIWDAVRGARPAKWGFSYSGEMLRTDLAIGAGGLAVVVLLTLLFFVTGHPTLSRLAFEVGLSMAIATPIILTILPIVILELLVTLTVLIDITVVLGTYVLVTGMVDARFHALAAVAAVLTLGAVLAQGQKSLRAWLHRVVFRSNLEQLAELQAFLRHLSPEAGVVECCRRALAELVRVRQLRGAAIILRDGTPIVHGTFNLAPLEHIWPRGNDADALPARAFGTAELRTLPAELRDGLVEANVGLGAAPIMSPTRRWGHLLMNTGLFGGFYRQDDVETLETFVTQLGLLLDSADLLARAVAVERSLAHSEKLAAIGETAARIAHEIRNPVTAARSLAQQLNRAPGAPDSAEYAALILTELERVERQVASLLRFARRDEYRFESVDIGALVSATVDGVRGRAAAAQINLHAHVAPGVTARADAEKLRQVLLNLFDNAFDALADGGTDRAVAVSVARVNGHARVTIADNGPGVPGDALAHLFEPFFSLKDKGTGLGLAIVKRTVDAHQGQIEAAAAHPGLAFAITLPLAHDSEPR
jgi:signal transduction histidine kinase